jgi:hypothetical protein
MIRYNTSTTSGFEGYAGGAWGSIGGGATGAGGDQVFYENELNVTTSYTLTTNRNAMSTGPITIDAGASSNNPIRPTLGNSLGDINGTNYFRF